MAGDGSPGIPVMAPIDGAPLVAASVASASPAVHFGEGRRPEHRTQVQMPEFDGPLALLLSLIEARQLDVLTVPLGALADAYLDALGRLEADRLGNVSSFVTIASQLILIKSRAMLPRRPTTRSSGSDRSGGSPGGPGPPRWPGHDRPMRPRSTRAVSRGRWTGWRRSPRRPSHRPRSWAARSPSPNAPRSSGPRCATPRGSSSRTS